MNPASEVDSTRFCPECGSASVDASSLAGGEASCRACSWKGKQEALLVHHFTMDGLGGRNAIFESFVKDVRNLLAKGMARPVLDFLIRWGFMVDADPKVLGRYLQSIALAIVSGTLKEREKIEKESRHG